MELEPLRVSLQFLALPAEEQIRLVQRLGKGGAEKLAENANRWAETAMKKYAGQLTAQQAVVLEVLVRLLKEMRGQGEASLWTESALKGNSRWEAIRQLACSGLDAFGWEEPDQA